MHGRIQQTTMVPGKVELLTAWLPHQDWYAGDPAGPSLARVGGFRLDDPAGEVGIEFLVVCDDAGQPVRAYLVPMTYRGSPLAGGDAALIGAAQHGVLGQRWIYDGTRDPVLLEQLAELIQHVNAARPGEVTGPWTAADGTVVRSLFATARPLVG